MAYPCHIVRRRQRLDLNKILTPRLVPIILPGNVWLCVSQVSAETPNPRPQMSLFFIT